MWASIRTEHILEISNISQSFLYAGPRQRRFFKRHVNLHSNVIEISRFSLSLSLSLFEIVAARDKSVIKSGTRLWQRTRTRQTRAVQLRERQKERQSAGENGRGEKEMQRWRLLGASLARKWNRLCTALYHSRYYVIQARWAGCREPRGPRYRSCALET